MPAISGRTIWQEDIYADMAELADAPDLGSGVHDVQVQVLLSAVKEMQKCGSFGENAYSGSFTMNTLPPAGLSCTDILPWWPDTIS